jgi:hypothetical protein
VRAEPKAGGKNKPKRDESSEAHESRLDPAG